MTADIYNDLLGFPPGYFIIRSVATNRLLDVTMDDIADGTELHLWPEKDSSLVESRRNPIANNQVFFIDTSGALCSRSAGHAVDIEDDVLVLRHRRPISHPFPNAYAHPLPRFCYSAETGEISVIFTSDPTYPDPPLSPASSQSWKNRSYILTSIPMHKPRTIIDDASAFLTSAISTPLSFLSGKKGSKAIPEEVFDGNFDLAEDEILETERGEEGEVDDSLERERKVRMLSILDKSKDDQTLGEKAKARRRWKITPLRTSNARTAG